MSLPEVVMWGVVLLVGVPASLNNATALALLAAWAFGEWFVWYFVNTDPTILYRWTDMWVVTVILSKPPGLERWWRGPLTLLVTRTRCDLIILAIIAVMWTIYDAAISEWTRYWLLWGLTFAQFMAAGYEAAGSFYASWRRVRYRNDRPPHALKLAWGRHG